MGTNADQASEKKPMQAAAVVSTSAGATCSRASCRRPAGSPAEASSRRQLRDWYAAGVTRESTHDGRAFSPRVHDFLEKVLLPVLFVVLFTGLLFGLRYESYNPLVGSFSSGYLAAGLGPAVLALALVCFFLLRSSWYQHVPKVDRSEKRSVLFGGSVLTLFAVLLWTAGIPERHLALALAIAVPAVGMLVVARAVGRPQLLLGSLPFAVVGAAILIVEVPLLVRPTPVRWGDDRLFAYLHPTRPPFMGAGGRLRANVDLDQMSAEFRRGAAVITNRDGFRNQRDFDHQPGDETRILSLGDSFSTGYAMPQDLFFGSLLERETQGLIPTRDVVVLNAEVSNPAHGLYYLQQYGVQYRPQVVLFGLSGNDLVQTEHFFGPRALFTFAGGGAVIQNPEFDRRRPSPIVRFRDFAYPVSARAPQSSGVFFLRRTRDRWLRHLGGFSIASWLGSGAAVDRRPVPMFSYAEVFEREDGRKRLIDGLSDLGLYYPPGATEVEGIYERFLAVLEGMRRVSEAAGAEFILVIFPQRFQLQPQDWQVMCEHWSLDSRDFELARPNRRLTKYCAEVGINCLDLLEPMREAAAEHELYLSGGDMHFNSVGCRLAADITAGSSRMYLCAAGNGSGTVSTGIQVIGRMTAMTPERHCHRSNPTGPAASEASWEF